MKALQCIDAIIPDAGHVVKVTFLTHFKTCDLHSNTTQLSSSLFKSGKIMSHSKLNMTFLVFSTVGITMFYHKKIE